MALVTSRSRALAGVLVAMLIAAACSSDDDPEPTTTTAAPPTTTTGAETTTTEAVAEGTLDQVALATQEIAVLDDPVAFAARPSSDDLYVAEKSGRVRVIEVSTTSGSDEPRYELRPEPLLDLSDEVIDQGEQGLLGLAFSSDGRRLYLNLTSEPDGRTLVLEYQVDDRDRAVVDRESRRELLEVEQPYANHNGGHLAVGPDGFLYIGLGDGGDAGDPHGHGQDTDTLLGSILRIDPIGGSEDGPAYAIPPGNPFADGSEGKPEIWLYGVRNPWRFSFDSLTGDLWVADVGQSEREEISRLPASDGFDAGKGANLGWDRMEGSESFEGENPSGAVLPVHEYSHDHGCSITGGHLYRGEAVAALQGTYLFADFCAAGVRGLQMDGDIIIDERTWDLAPEGLQSFGQDRDGEIYLLLASGPVLKIVPASGG